MFRATILRIDNSVLIDSVEVYGQRGKRGSGDGLIWRGHFAVPGTTLRPTLGETILIALPDSAVHRAVVTEVAGSIVHFRAPGVIPPPDTPAVSSPATSQQRTGQD